MKKIVIFCFSFLLLLPMSFSQEKKKDKVKYEKRERDKVIKEMLDENKNKRKEKEKKTKEIIKNYKQKRKEEKGERKRIRFDVSDIQKPTSLDIFKKVWHFEPVAQFLTSTCWDFSTTSFFESEIKRIHNKEIKISEMFTAYYEFVEKARGYVKTRGQSLFTRGSESNAVTRIWKKYGIVPYEAYKGVLRKDNRYDHSKMFSEMKNYLLFIKENNYWDEKMVTEQIKVILNKYMGEPPKEFDYKGKKHTPKSFLNKIVKLNLDDYLGFMSTKSIPFYSKGKFDVPDNWWHSKDYYNVPLEDFYSIIKTSIKNEYSLTIGGDVSEPGYYGEEDIAVIPTFDISQEYIDQDSREMRIYNHTTTDDHGVHIVGYSTIGGRDWYLIKDSARSSRHGNFKGYYFYRGDYIKLKMLTIMVHKDCVKEILKKFNEN